MVVGEIAMHVSDVLTRHFFDDQSPIIGDKKATITAFTFTWGTSGQRHLGTQNRLEALFLLYMKMQVIDHSNGQLNVSESR